MHPKCGGGFSAPVGCTGSREGLEELYLSHLQKLGTFEMDLGTFGMQFGWLSQKQRFSFPPGMDPIPILFYPRCVSRESAPARGDPMSSFLNKENPPGFLHLRAAPQTPNLPHSAVTDFPFSLWKHPQSSRAALPLRTVVSEEVPTLCSPEPPGCRLPADPEVSPSLAVPTRFPRRPRLSRPGSSRSEGRNRRCCHPLE